MPEGTVANPTNNSALAQFQSASSVLVDWSTALAQSAQNVIGVLGAWNNATNAPVAQVPNNVKNPPAKTVDDTLQKTFFYVGVGMVLVAGGIFLYKSV